ncbi:MAG: hypothetical protein NUV73_03905 [Candidatus Daviesbacteria bacterium]|nr:hypothetical protein [Candidatus Daviesbacteria bacterium]
MSEISQNLGSVKPEVKPYIVQGERIPQAEVAAVAEDFGTFYGLSSEIIDRAKQAEAYYVTETEFAQAIQEQIRDDVKSSMDMADSYAVESGSFMHLSVQVDKESLQSIMANEDEFALTVKRIAQDESQNTTGRVISKPGDRELVLLKNTIASENRGPTLEHEMIHVLASSGFSRGTGFAFYQPILGYLNIPLNEGATEILRLHRRFPNANINGLARFFSETPNYPYSVEAQRLLEVLGAYDMRGGFSFTIKDLARHYFSRRESILTDKSGALIKDIEQHTPKRYRKYVHLTIDRLGHKDYLDGSFFSKLAISDPS